MSKFKHFNNEILPLITYNNNNSSIARELFPEGTANEIERLRKHIANIRIFGIPHEKEKVEKVSHKKSLAIEVYKGGNPDNILVIGDLHAPFTLPKYLKFCREQQEIHDCGTVIFIGDVIDNHFSSYHESDPDGYGAGEELDRAIDMIADWYHTFPKATVIIGNHDRLVYRKAYSSGVSKRWIKEYSEVLNTSGWDFVENIELFGVNFNHGEGGTAKNRIKSELQSQVQGHLHTQLYTEYLVGANFIVFGMQVGCGVDNKSYAMSYGKNFKKPAIGCGVVLNKGTLPIALPMKM
jgi:predicted phosphodiesterase